MSTDKELSELVNAGVISTETAHAIKVYYEEKQSASPNKLIIVFGLLGATLIGLGIILMIAHNWDQLSRSTKTLIAFAPLLIGQLLSGYSLWFKENNIAWREGSGVFLFFGLGGGMAMISQIYNLPGELSDFILTWMLLSLPLFYLLRAHTIALFYSIGIVTFVIITGYLDANSSKAILFWPLLLGAFPHYFLLIRHQPKSNFTLVQNWLFPISIVIALGSLNGKEELFWIAYMGLFGLFVNLGATSLIERVYKRNNELKIIGSLGTLYLLYIFSFDEIWDTLREERYSGHSVTSSPAFYGTILIVLLALSAWFLAHHNKKITRVNPIYTAFILFLFLFVLNFFVPFSFVFANIIILIVGLVILKKGAENEDLRKLNLGLIIIAILIACRFFDTDLSFIVRGIIFLLVGLGFLTANLWVLKKKRTDAN